MKVRSLAGVCSAVLVSAVISFAAPPLGAVADPPGATYTVLGQPDTSKDTLLTRCTNADARFNKNDFGGGFVMAGPSGVVVTPTGRLFAVDSGGQRVLSWPDADALSSCQVADKVIGGPAVFTGPEALTVGPDGTVYVADTLQHTVQIFTPDGNGDYPATPQVVLGQQWTSGSAGDQLHFPRGLALDDAGRLFVADDYNHRIQIFAPPFTTGQFANDGIGAGNNGGFSSPKALAFADGSLFVADFWNSRVLRFPAPFDDPATVYTADATITGVGQPVDLTVSDDGTLYVTDGGSGGAPSVKEYPGATTGGDQTAAVDEHRLGGLLTGPSPDNGSQPEPLGVAVTPAGRLIVADYAGYRLVIETPAGVDPGLVIPGTDLVDARVQVAYSAKLAATGGTGTLTWSLTGNGSLPPGLKLSAAGVISGKPTTTGSYAFEVTVRDRSVPVRTGTATLTLDVLPMEVLFNGGPGPVGKRYSTKFRAVGGKAAIVYSQIGGTVPPGLKLTPQGALSGVPTVPGTYDLDVFAVDKGVPQNSAHLSVTITITPLSIGMASTTVSVGQKVTLKPTVSGGKNPLKWSISDGALPPGLKLSAFNGQITGTTTAAGTYDFRLTAVDATKAPGPNSDDVDVTVTVVP